MANFLLHPAERQAMYGVTEYWFLVGIDCRLFLLLLRLQAHLNSRLDERHALWSGDDPSTFVAMDCGLMKARQSQKSHGREDQLTGDAP
jgi:hypothetical protein